jgi:MscS family membrane protein
MTSGLFALADVTPSARDIFKYFTFGRFAAVALILFLGWVLMRYASRALLSLASRGSRVRFAARLVEPVIRIVLWFVALFLCFGILAPSEETFFAALGTVAIAVGLGLQDLIKNLVGGMVILADRPYQIGDRVRIENAYGEIDHIGLRSTKLTTPDETRVTIPNAKILETLVFNANSGVPQCQIVTEIYLPITADPDEALRIGREAAVTCPYLYAHEKVQVLLADGFSNSPYMLLRIKAYVCDHRFEPAMQTDITLRAKREFRRLGLLAAWAGGAEPAAPQPTPAGSNGAVP